MTPEQKAAYVFAEAVSALIKMQGMVAANEERARRKQALAYHEEHFLELEREYVISHNAVLSLFHG